MSNPVVWFEVVGKDGEGLRRFYSDLFGWHTQSAEGDTTYGLVMPTNAGIGGGVGQSQDGGARHVTFFVEVDDPAAYLARAEQLGGRTVVPTTPTPSGGACRSALRARAGAPAADRSRTEQPEDCRHPRGRPSKRARPGQQHPGWQTAPGPLPR